MKKLKRKNLIKYGKENTLMLLSVIPIMMKKIKNRNQSISFLMIFWNLMMRRQTKN